MILYVDKGIKPISIRCKRVGTVKLLQVKTEPSINNISNRTYILQLNSMKRVK